MKNILEILFEKHSTWVKYVVSFGCRKDIAEDFVQEMYIKIYNSKKKDTNLMYNEKEVNYYFVYVILKNMYYDNLRRNKNIKNIPLEEVVLIDNIDYSEKDFNQQSKALSIWVAELDEEINSILEYTKYKASLCYIKFIYQKIFVENYSVTDLSSELNLSYWSIRNTVVRIKKQIKDEI